MQRLTWRWRLLAAVIVGLVRLLRWRVQVEGLDHVPPSGGAVIAFNHHSHLDFIFLAWPSVRRLRRPVRFLAKREMWSSRWVGWAVRWGEAVPVDRGSSAARAGALDAAVDALRHGDLIAVAPEQTISESFELLPFRTGAARMAQLAGVPLIPAIGWGTQRCVTKGLRPRLLTGLPVVVHFGSPVEVRSDADPAQVTAELHLRMTRLLHEVQESYPDGAPRDATWVPERLGGGAPAHADVLRSHRQRSSEWDRDVDESGRSSSSRKVDSENLKRRHRR